MTMREMLNIILKETNKNTQNILSDETKEYYKHNPYYFFDNFFNIKLTTWQNIYIKAILSVDKNKNK